MKLSEFRGLSSELLEFQVLEHRFDHGSIRINQPVTFFMDDDQCYMAQADKIWLVKSLAAATAPVMARIENDRSLWILEKVAGNSLWVASTEMARDDLPINLDMGVSEYFIEQLLSKGAIRENKLDLAVEWLREEFLVDDGEIQFAFALVYANTPDKMKGLNLLGRSYLLQLGQSNHRWSVEKLRRYHAAEHSLFRIRGRLAFKDATVAARVHSAIHRESLDNSIAAHGSYIARWELYSQIHWQRVVSRALALGCLPIQKMEPSETQPGIWFLYAASESIAQFRNAWEALGEEEDKELQVAADRPDWLDDKTDIRQSGLERQRRRPWRARPQKFEKDRIQLKFNAERNERPHLGDQGRGYVFLSIHGTLAQRQRQMYALKQIRDRTNPMHQLHWLLQGVEPPISDGRKTLKLSAKARKLFNKGQPTQKQEQAIGLALNTPDIAIVIGPPGTGKTQVITALQQCIAETGHPNMPVQHQVLLSSYQHDAVDNAISRSRVLGFPGVKVGGKQTTDDEQMVDPIESWSFEQQPRLQRLLDDHPVLTAFKDFQDACLLLRLGGDAPDQRQKSLGRIESLLARLAVAQLRLSAKLEMDWQQFKTREEVVSCRAELRLMTREIRALRTQAVAFADDGPQRCHALAIKLASWSGHTHLLEEGDLPFLLEMASLDHRATHVQPDSLTALRELKDRLLDASIPDYRPLAVRKVLGEGDCQLLDHMVECLAGQLKSSRSLGHLVILDEYLSALKHSANAVKNSARHYTAVLGATCQQAAGDKMVSIKESGSGGVASVVFDTVIIDEAARANPLDLMIPMAMASKRIILVGDHRQLPHLLEPDVEEKLVEQQKLNEEQREELKESLFERLVKSLRQLQDNNPDQPKRVIMLDTQFRMHQVLGDFISQNFYENHRLPAIKSQRPDSDFLHGVPGYEEKVCAWLDVPASAGVQERGPGGQSRQRRPEARRIAIEAKKIMDNCPQLSVGVITFYSAQRDCIFEELAYLGVAERSANGYVISPEYRALSVGGNIGKERLRVGSVDAFQGKEFDVVLVSLVRTLRPDFQIDRLDYTEKQKALNGAYGFLLLDNRLNVALSRQRSLLIMVGDLDVATHPVTRSAVPALVALEQLCGGVHGTIIR